MRAQLKHVLLDVDFLNNPKVRSLKTKFGHISQLCLIDIYSAMSRATNAVIDKDCIEAIISEYEVKIEFLDYCLEKGLISSEMGGYSNSVVIKDQEQYFKKLNSGKSKNIPEQNFPEKIQEKSTPDYDYDNELNIKETVSEDPPQSIRPGPFRILRFDQIQWETLQMQEDPQELKRSIEIAEAHIETFKTADKQRYLELCRKAEQGKAYLMGWAKSAAYSQISNEKAAKAREEKAKQPFQKPQEAPRPQPKEYKPPELPEVSEEQRQINLQKLRSITRKTTEGVRA